MKQGPCMAPGCTLHGAPALVVSGQPIFLCAAHVAQAKSGAQLLAVRAVQGVEQRVPGFVDAVLRGVRVMRALRDPLPEPDPIVVEAKVV